MTVFTYYASLPESNCNRNSGLLLKPNEFNANAMSNAVAHFFSFLLLFCLTVRRFKFILLKIVIGWTIRSSSDFLLHWHTQPDYFWPRFYIVVLGMTFLFFRLHLLFSIFYLDFYFPLLFGLLIPFSIWFFISLFFLVLFFFLFSFFFFISFSFLFHFFFISFSILSRSLILDSSIFFFSFRCNFM